MRAHTGRGRLSIKDETIGQSATPSSCYTPGLGRFSRSRNGRNSEQEMWRNVFMYSIFPANVTTLLYWNMPWFQVSTYCHIISSPFLYNLVFGFHYFLVHLRPNYVCTVNQIWIDFDLRIIVMWLLTFVWPNLLIRPTSNYCNCLMFHLVCWCFDVDVDVLVQ